MRVHETARELVREVTPLAGDMRGQPGDAELSLALPLAMPTLPGNGTLGAAQSLGRVLRALRRQHRLASV
jgi:hypothetical protein